MRRRAMMEQGGNTISGKDSAVAGDILCANSDGLKMVVKAADYASIPSGYEAIGVVVIPPSHDVYGTGEGAAMSLRYMNIHSPDIGSDSTQRLYWGQRDTDISFPFLGFINTTNTPNPTISSSSTSYLPSDNIIGAQCITDPKAYYMYSPYAPSPYLSNGSRNEYYYTTKYTAQNAFSDFNGKGNTNILCSLATAQSDWRTASTITNSDDKGYSPAACCCWRYNTVGTNQGDWYLPAMGELGYLEARLKTIQNSMSNIGGIILTSSSVWTSTSYSYRDACYMSLNDGYATSYYKYYYFSAISFIRF